MTVLFTKMPIHLFLFECLLFHLIDIVYLSLIVENKIECFFSYMKINNYFNCK